MNNNGFSASGHKRAVLYARVSTKHQEKHGYRLATQFNDMRAYAANNDLTVVNEYQEAYTATVPFRERPNGSLIYEAIDRGEIDAVVVHELDRAARGDTSYEMPIDFMVFWRDLQEANVELHSCDVGMVQDGILTLVQSWQSNQDNRKRRQRSMDGRRDKIKKGLFPGNGPRCYGYDKIGQRKNTHLAINEEEAAVIRLIFRWYVYELLGVVEIAKRLTAMGVPSFADKHKKGKLHGAGEWVPGMIYPILKRETYAGVWYAYRYKMVKVPGQRKKKRVRRPKSEWVPIDVPAIIDRATWNMTQARLKQGRAMSKRNNLSHEYLMGRRLTCKCGYHIQGKPCWSKDVVYLYYRCNGTSKTLTAGDCDLPGFNAKQVDGAVWAWVKSLLADPEKMLVGWQESQQEAQEQSKPLQQELDRVNALIAENEAKKDKLLDAYLDGIFEREVLRDRKTELDKLLTDLRKRQLEIENHLKTATITDQQIHDFIAFAESVRGELELDDIHFEAKRKLIDQLNVTSILAVENGEKVVYATCHAGRECLSVNPSNWL